MFPHFSKKILLLCLFLTHATFAENSHYNVTLARDIPLTFFAAFASLYGNHALSEMEVPEEGPLEKSKLLPWDRPVAGRYSKSADKASDWAAVLGVAPLALGAYSWNKGDASSYDFAAFSLMFAQSLAIQNGVNLIVRSLAFWPRPYIYAQNGSGYSEAKKAKGEAYGSFFSGHASAAFTVAYFTGEWFSEMNPASPYKKIVWASAFSAASLVGALRIAAGKHYPTDVFAGALAGVSISYAVIEIHKSPSNRISLWGGFNSLGVSLRI